MIASPQLAVDLGGTRLRVALVADGVVLARSSAPTDTRGPEAVVAQIQDLARSLVDGTDDTGRDRTDPHPPTSIAVAAPGPLDPATGTMHALPNLAGWDGFPLGAALAESFGLPAFVHNDASLAALGEARRGAGQGARVLVYLTISTGIGGGIVVGGQLMEGAHGLAGELGHVVVRPGSSARCGAGHAGCLEALASGTAIARAVAERRAEGEPTALGAEADAAAVATAARAGDALAASVYERAAADLGIALAGFINAFDPDVVVLGGGVALGAWDLLAPGALRAAAPTIMAPGARSWKLVRAELGDDAGLVGAAEWAAAQRHAGG